VLVSVIDIFGKWRYNDNKKINIKKLKQKIKRKQTQRLPTKILFSLNYLIYSLLKKNDFVFLL